MQEKGILSPHCTSKQYFKVISRSPEGHVTYYFFSSLYPLSSCQISSYMELCNLGIQHFTKFGAILDKLRKQKSALWPQGDRVE